MEPIALGATIAIMQAGQILLTRREDFDIWCLPGGHVDPGESVAQAAIREAREETGLDVELLRLVGVYSLPAQGAGSHAVLFAARPVGGTLRPQPDEVLEVRYFPVQALPEPILWWHRQRIQDALAGVGGSVAWTQNATLQVGGEEMTRQELYAYRDRSGLSRRAFYLEHFPRPETGAEVREVKGTVTYAG